MTAVTESHAESQALAERLFHATIATLEIGSIHVGRRLGYYRSLARDGAATAGELAGRTGTDVRYAREWLEQQAVAGFLVAEDPASAPEDRRFALPDAYRSVLAEAEHLDHVAPLATLAVGVLRPIDALLDAYRTGGGIPYEAYGEDTREGIGSVNRPQFLNCMADWLAAVPDVDRRLRSEPAARVADVACGTGWSSIAIARAYPRVLVDALDLDEASIRTATANVERAGLVDRVRPVVRDAGDPRLEGRYDLVTIFEALHDMNHPVEALAAARRMLAPGGCVIVADERVAERFVAPGDEIERFNYGWSVLHCLPVGTTEPDAAATGTVLRPGALRDYATAAGFGDVEVLPVQNDFWRFYRLR